eukprot:675738-Alexandrium_andersonii.AAC.1
MWSCRGKCRARARNRAVRHFSARISSARGRARPLARLRARESSCVARVVASHLAIAQAGCSPRAARPISGAVCAGGKYLPDEPASAAASRSTPPRSPTPGSATTFWRRD